MRRIGPRSLALALGTAVLAAACGSSTTTTSTGHGGAATSPATSPPTGSHAMIVRPAAPHPSSTVTFTFTPPQSAGRAGKAQLSYSVLVSGPARTGCVASHGAAPASAVKGRPATVTLGPAQLGGQWCQGTYTARAQELQRPVCAAGQACPMYIRVVGTVASATFTVAG